MSPDGYVLVWPNPKFNFNTFIPQAVFAKRPSHAVNHGMTVLAAVEISGDRQPECAANEVGHLSPESRPLSMRLPCPLVEGWQR